MSAGDYLEGRDREHWDCGCVLGEPHGKTCAICGGTDDVRHRGWTDEGLLMLTCTEHGSPA